MEGTEAKTEQLDWCILELMGHRRLGGKISEATIAGAAMLRIDVPGPGDVSATQYYSGAAVYCITPTTEAIARAVANLNRPEPVSRWELPAANVTTAANCPDGDDCPYADEHPEF